MRPSKPNIWRVVALLALVAGCANSKGSSTGTAGSASGGNAPGVSADTVRVTAIATVTGPTGVDLTPFFNGVQAYFDMVNASGGVHGRRFELVEKRDDHYLNLKQEVQSAIAQDDMFGFVMYSYAAFGPTAAVLREHRIPSVNAAVASDVAGQEVAFYTPTYPGDVVSSLYPQLAKDQGFSKVALLSYTDPASANCVKTIETSFERYKGAQVAFVDQSLSFADYAAFPADVAHMREAGVDVVIPCLDINAVLELAKEMHKQQLGAKQVVLNMYNPSFVAANKEVLEGDIVITGTAVPELRQPPSSVKDFTEWTANGGYTVTEDSYGGWAAAATFVEGVRGAGTDLTRDGFIRHLTSLTAWDADGFMPKVDYSTGVVAKPAATDPFCQGTPLKVVDGRFEALAPPGTPFLCGTTASDAAVGNAIWR